MQQPPYDRPPLSTPGGDNPNFGSSAINNSGQPGAQLPAELQGLNFGAFLLNWIWAIGHNYWLGLLCLVPCVGVVMQFYYALQRQRSRLAEPALGTASNSSRKCSTNGCCGASAFWW